jgi:hypothetical protein
MTMPNKLSPRFVALMATTGLVMATSVARADGEPTPAPQPAPAAESAPALAPSPPPEVAVVSASPVAEPDRVDPSANPSKYAIDRTTLYGDDAKIPQPLVIVATSSVSYTNIGGDPTYVSSPYPGLPTGCYTASGTPKTCYSTFANNTAQPGVSTQLAGELGLFPRVSILGNIAIGGGIPENGSTTGSTANQVPNPDVGGQLSLRVNPLPASWKNLHGVVSLGYDREAWNPPVYNDNVTPAVWIPGTLSPTNGGFLQLAMSGDIGRLRMNGMFHAQHTFAPGRDPLDITVDLNASYRLVGRFRAGLEYVGQDLEETFSPGAEGGPRHFLGPVASVQVWNDRITIIGGPSLGLSALSPDFVARVGASIGF